MAAYNEHLFNTPTGTATPLLHARWRAKGALIGIQPKAQLTAGGYATKEFRSLWRSAFPTRDPLPVDVIHTRDGKPSEYFLAVWV